MQTEIIYIIIIRNKHNMDFTSIAISSECYTKMKDAINFCKSKLTKQELALHQKQIDRGLIHWFEFDSKDYEYRIKVLDVKGE